MNSSKVLSATPATAGNGERPPRRRTVLLFDGARETPGMEQSLRAAGFMVISKRPAEGAAALLENGAIDVILAGTHELDQTSRRLVEQLRAARPAESPLFVFGLGTPMVTALARGRRRSMAREKHDRRSGAPHRHLFDDFIGLPFDLARLVYLIEAWELAVDTRRSAEARPPVNPDAISMLAALGGAMLTRELIESSQIAIPEFAADIRHALADRDPEAMRHAAHDLKSAGALLGAERVRDIAAMLEAMGSGGCQDGAAKLAESLDGELLRINGYLRLHQEWLEAEPAGPNLDLRELAGVYKGRRIVAYGLEPRVTERLRTVLEALHCAFTELPAAAWKSGEASGSADLRILGLGELDQGEATAWRAAIEDPSGGPVLLVLRDDSAVLGNLAARAAGFVANGELNQLLIRAYRLLLAAKPLKPPAAVTAPPAKASPVPPPKPHLLVAEDDPLTARFLVGSLLGAGFDVTHVTTGQAAIDICSGRSFTAAVLDITMPEVDGYGVLSHLRRTPEFKDIPVLMLSGRSQEKDILKALQLGADDYVTKPFSPPELLLRLAKLLERR